MSAHSALYMPSVFKQSRPSDSEERPYFDVPKHEWYMPVGIMLCLSLVGLSFYPAIPVFILLLIKLFRHNRTDFIIVLTILGGGYGFIDTKIGPLNTYDILMVAGFVLLTIYKKTRIIKATIWVLSLYIAALVIIATYSLESLAVQFNQMRGYFSFVYFIVPLACFSGKEFDVDYFFKRIVMYAMIICAFCIIDAYILFGDFLIPLTSNAEDVTNTIFNPYIKPFAFHTFRKLPRGMYPVLLAIYPVSRCFRFRWWQWAIFLGALASTLTFTLISGAFLTYIFFKGKLMRVLRYCLLGIVGLVALYFVDGLLPHIDKAVYGESTLRIKSTVDQVIRLFDAVDDEDISRFASGRMAQIMPKVELVFKEDKQWTGLGFLHPEKTHIERYVIINEYYIDVQKSEELAIGVEMSHVQIFLSAGFIGLACHYIFLLALCLIIRRQKYASYFGSLVFVCLWMGVSGLATLNSMSGLGLIALAYAVVIMANRKPKSDNDKKQTVEVA